MLCSALLCSDGSLLIAEGISAHNEMFRAIVAYPYQVSKDPFPRAPISEYSSGRLTRSQFIPQAGLCGDFDRVECYPIFGLFLIPAKAKSQQIAKH